jgi:hypothetical protein
MKINDSFDDLDIALYHLVFIGNLIENTIRAFTNIIDKTEEVHERALYVSTFSIILIQTVSFLDEYHNFIKSPDEELNNTIKTIKKAVKPAVEQINDWKEIRDFRNHVLAHNLRDRKKMTTVFEKGLSSYDIPKNGADLLVLYNCILMIKKTFESAFRAKLQALQMAFDHSSERLKENKFNNSDDAKAVIEKITNEINTNILQLKIDAGVL